MDAQEGKLDIIMVSARKIHWYPQPKNSIGVDSALEKRCGLGLWMMLSRLLILEALHMAMNSITKSSIPDNIGHQR